MLRAWHYFSPLVPVSCADIYADIEQRNLFYKSDVQFGYVSWQSILRELKKLQMDCDFKALIISDLINLLTRKGLEQFVNMHIKFDAEIKENLYFEFNYHKEKAFSFENNILITTQGDYFYDFK